MGEDARSDATKKNKKTKIAILGGGPAGLSAAFHLTHPCNPRRKEYEITVYQLGWRLGGKGATGRDAEHHDRIEEHGIIGAQPRPRRTDRLALP